MRQRGRSSYCFRALLDFSQCSFSALRVNADVGFRTAHNLTVGASAKRSTHGSVCSSYFDLEYLIDDYRCVGPVAALNLASRSRIRNRNRCACSSRSMSRFRAVCAIHSPLGRAMIPPGASDAGPAARRTARTAGSAQRLHPEETARPDAGGPGPQERRTAWAAAARRRPDPGGGAGGAAPR